MEIVYLLVMMMAGAHSSVEKVAPYQTKELCEEAAIYAHEQTTYADNRGHPIKFACIPVSTKGVIGPFL